MLDLTGNKSRKSKESMTKVKLSTVCLTCGALLHPLSHRGDPIIVKGCFKESQQGSAAAPGQAQAEGIQLHPAV